MCSTELKVTTHITFEMLLQLEFHLLFRPPIIMAA